MSFVELLQKEWVTLRAAPFSFFLLIAVSFSSAYAAVSWYYDSRIKILNERLDQKDQQISDMQARLEFTPALGNQYAKHSNKDLRHETLRIVAELRDLLERARAQRRAIDAQYDGLSHLDKTEEQRRQRRQAYLNASNQPTDELLRNYEKSFKGRIILLLEELRKRVSMPLSIQPQPRMPVFDLLYERPTNPIGVETIADALEEYARRL